MVREIVTSENKADYDQSKINKTPYDPGVVNVPLSKRGNIDAQLDRYKAEQAKNAKTEAKIKAEETRTNKQKAKEMLAEHMDSMLKVHGPKYGEKNLKSMFTDWSKWQPEKLIKFVEGHKAAQEKLASQ